MMEPDYLDPVWRIKDAMRNSRLVDNYRRIPHGSLDDDALELLREQLEDNRRGLASARDSIQRSNAFIAYTREYARHMEELIAQFERLLK